MLHVISCIAYEHNIALVAMAALLCTVASVAAFNLVERAKQKSERARVRWFLVAATAAGYGVWATHFVGMVAYEISVPNGYDILETILSACVAIICNGAAFALVLADRVPRWRFAVGGAIAGLGISAMHYIGMDAWRVAAIATWNWDFVIASILAGAALGALAFHTGWSGSDWRWRAAGAAIFVLAIVAMHFTAMSALTLTPASGIEIGTAQPVAWMVDLLIIATLLILGACLFAAILDEHLVSRAAQENARLQDHIAATMASEASARRLATLVETATDAISILDSKGEVVLWANAAFCRYAGCEPHDVVGKTIPELGLTPVSATPTYAEWSDALARGDIVQAHLEVQTAVGRKHFEGTVRPLVDEATGALCRISTLHDVTQRVKAQKLLRDSEERYQLVIRGSDDGIWDWEIDGDKLFASPRAHELIGLVPDDPQLNSISQLMDLLHPEDRPMVAAAMKAHLSERVPYRIDHRVRMRDGAYRWFRVRAQAIWDDIGNATRMAGSISDIDDLIRTTTEAQQSNLLKSQFLANMSHEIRTPMNGVVGTAQLLMRTSLDEKQTRFVNMILSSSRALLEIINDILDLSKIESGLMTLNLDSIDMQSMIETALERVSGITTDKKVKVDHTICPSRLGTFEGDQSRIVQVLVNLLGNAIKFTEEGSITLSVSAAANGSTRFAVRDTGPGIPEEQFAAVFERFRQADGSSTRKHGGTGLGLSISSELVRLMEGKMCVESKLGEGSTFWFDLPITIQSRAALHTDATNSKSITTLGGVRALVAEDNALNRLLMVEMLETLGIEPTMASNGRLAIGALERQSFDVLITDIQMPEMNGDVMINTIRASSKPYAKIPILVVTADAMKGAEEQYLAMGANGYIAKPIDIDILEHMIAGVVGKLGAKSAA